MATGDVAPTPLRGPRALIARARAFLARHERVLWWLHSLYALGLGVSIVLFAQKSFEHARWLLFSGGGTWLILLFLSWLQRWQESKSASAETMQDATSGDRGRRRWGFLAVTYVLKNLYQGMLFFALPFYFKSSSFDSANVAMLVVLALFALLSTLDVVFDRVIVKRTLLVSIFHGVVLFACINLITPALFDQTSSSTALVLAATIAAVAATSLHLMRTPRSWQLSLAAVFGASVLAAGGAYLARRYVPPVPMHLAYAKIGPGILESGKLTMEVTTLDRSVLSDVYAVTDVVLPAGKRESFVHVWRHEGEVAFISDEAMARVPSPEGEVRLRSVLPKQKLPAQVVGKWSVDVETLDGRLIGRARFTVTE